MQRLSNEQLKNGVLSWMRERGMCRTDRLTKAQFAEALGIADKGRAVMRRVYNHGLHHGKTSDGKTWIAMHLKNRITEPLCDPPPGNLDSGVSSMPMDYPPENLDAVMLAYIDRSMTAERVAELWGEELDWTRTNLRRFWKRGWITRDIIRPGLALYCRIDGRFLEPVVQSTAGTQYDNTPGNYAVTTTLYDQATPRNKPVFGFDPHRH